MLLTFLVIFAVVLISGVGLNPLALLCLPIVMVVEYIMALGIAMLTSAVTVYFRDLEHILGIVSMAWIYDTMYTRTWCRINCCRCLTSIPWRMSLNATAPFCMRLPFRTWKHWFLQRCWAFCSCFWDMLSSRNYRNILRRNCNETRWIGDLRTGSDEKV